MALLDLVTAQPSVVPACDADRALSVAERVLLEVQDQLGQGRRAVPVDPRIADVAGRILSLSAALEAEAAIG